MDAAKPVTTTSNHGSSIALRKHSPSLPPNTKLEYLNEGAANVVYRFSLPKPIHSTSGHVPEDPYWNGKLLRLRKKLPTTAPCQVAQTNYEYFVKPHFRSCDVIGQCLVEIRTSGIIKVLNQELKKWEMMPWEFQSPSMVLGRPTKRQGIYLADDNYCLLVQDMTPGPSQELYEFKPKWLVQSLAAPPYSKRCRTCAKRARNNALSIRSGVRLPPPSTTPNAFCPLDLTSKRDSVLYRIGKTILNLDGQDGPLTPVQSAKVMRFIDWTKTSPLLAQLKHLQTRLDRHGIFASDAEDKDFLTAMTIRDCTVFLHINLDGGAIGPITARIGDLDLKSPAKIEYWRAFERLLIDEGWYAGTENEEDRQPLDCALFPEVWTPAAERAALKALRGSEEVQ